MVRLTFHGAAGEVTGSCYLIETPRARVLVDFGMHQGTPLAMVRNRRMPPIDPGRLDAVVLTHAHLDHCGRLPMLDMAGFRGPIFCTDATRELSRIILLDSSHVQQEDAERIQRHRRRGRAGRAPQPLYFNTDVERALALFNPVPYSSRQEIADGVSIRLLDAGHILGSATVEMSIADGGRTRTLTFSGDIGERNHPLIKDPATPVPAETVIMESTYGDRDHKTGDGTERELAAIIAQAVVDGGKILIPAFAVGRTQSLVYFLGKMRRTGDLGRLPVIIDSPMAIASTELYRRHRDCFDDDALAIIDSGDSPLDFPGLRFTRTRDESAALNRLEGPAIIIAASGMCNAGRILHHLRHNVGRPETRIVIVGFQAAGTIGCQLLQGARSIRILGEQTPVRASVHTLGGLSAHAGRTGLLRWSDLAVPRESRLFLTHGEQVPRMALAESLRSRTTAIQLPQYGESFVL